MMILRVEAVISLPTSYMVTLYQTYTLTNIYGKVAQSDKNAKQLGFLPEVFSFYIFCRHNMET